MSIRRKWLAILAGGCAGLALGASPCAGAASGGAALQIVKLKFAAFNRHDTAEIEKLYAAGAHLHSPDHPDLSGNTGIAQTYRELFAAIPDAKDNVMLIEAAPRRVYAQFVLTGHFGGAQDKPVSVRIMSVYEVSGGHIVDDQTYYDRKI